MKELQARMDSEEFAYWVAYHSGVEPIGPERADCAIAINSATVAQSVMKKGRTAKAADYMPNFGGTRKPRMSEESMMSVIRSWKRGTDPK